MDNATYYKNLITENFPDYKITVENIGPMQEGALNIQEGVKVIVTLEKLKEPLVNSYQIIRGDIRGKEYNMTKEEASSLLLNSITETITEYEDSLEG